jgi:hypothetical protein
MWEPTCLPIIPMHVFSWKSTAPKVLVARHWKTWLCEMGSYRHPPQPLYSVGFSY